MEPNEVFGIIYLAVFLFLIVGGGLIWRRLDMTQKKVWHPRLSLLTVLVLGPLIVLHMVVWGHWMFGVLGAAVIALIGYISVTKVRVCDKCGTVVQPDNFFVVARFCPNCSAQLSEQRLFNRARL